jgi:hypothetical protein
MKKPNIILALICIHIFLTAAISQTAKFDIVTYTPPAGWSAEKDENSVRFSTETDAGYCTISLVRSIDATGDAGKDFDLLWELMAKDGLNATALQGRRSGERDGWLVEAGGGAFEKEGLTGAVILTTFSGNGKAVAVLVITNTDAFESNIAAFIDSIKLPPVAAPKALAALPAAAPSGDAAKLIGRWQRSSSSSPAYADPVSWGTAGYTRSRYEFKSDGTYIYTERTFRMTHPRIFIVKENGRYAVAGNTLTITPSKSTISAYNKAGGSDALGTLATTQNRKIEKIAYKFTFHYFSGIDEWNLVLQADATTQRDGPFSGNTTFNNAWYFDQKYTNTDLTAIRVN